MMELGATVCLPREPACGECPLAERCLAKGRGTAAERPVRRRRPQPPTRSWAAAVVERGGSLLIVRRLPEGLLGGLWELPGGEVAANEGSEDALRRHLRDGLGMEVQVRGEIAVVRHAYTHFRVTVQVRACEAEGQPHPNAGWDGHHWLAPEESGDYGLTGVTTKILVRVPWAGSGLLVEGSLPRLLCRTMRA